jgi:hypothetical protein
MTPPIFHLDDEVETLDGKTRFKISQIWKNQDGSISYSAIGEAYHPASSLRLIEGLKIGDWVEVIGPFIPGYIDTGIKCFKITETHEEYGGETSYRSPGQPRYRAASLRKLTPEEIAMHTGTIGYQMQKCSEDTEKAANALREILAPLIAKRQDGQHDQIDAIEEDLDKIFKRLSILEGEMPEVCNLPLPLVGLAMSMCGPVPACIASSIRHESEEAEKRKQKGTCDEEDCNPNTEPINISICLGVEESYTKIFRCHAEALEWCEKVLDSMREA